MAFREDNDIFSPVRYDNSLADSINSGGSITNIEMGLSFKEFSQNVFPDVELEEQKNIFSPTSEGLSMDKISKKSSFPISPLASLKDSSKNSLNSKKLSIDSKTRSLKLRISRDKNSFAKENNKNDRNQHKEDESQDIDLTSSAEQSNIKVKRPTRPTSLLPMNKASESSTSKDIKKIQNKTIKKSSLLKNMKGADETYKKSTVILSQKDSLNKKSVDVAKIINTQKHDDASVKQTQTKNISVNSEKSVKSRISQQLKDSKPTSASKLQSEDKVVEKMVHDCINFECDKIRQNMYLQQMSFYRQIHEIKDNMEHQHLATTDRLCKMIEELMRVNVFLKEQF